MESAVAALTLSAVTQATKIRQPAPHTTTLQHTTLSATLTESLELSTALQVDRKLREPRKWNYKWKLHLFVY